MVKINLVPITPKRWHIYTVSRFKKFTAKGKSICMLFCRSKLRNAGASSKRRSGSNYRLNMQAILSVISYLIATIKLDVFIPEIPPELLSLQYAVLKSSTLPKTISATPPSVAKALIAPVT